MVAGLLCAVMATFSILYVDRPVAEFVLNFQHWRFFDLLAAPSLLPLPGACVFMVYYAMRVVAGRPASATMQLLLSLSIAVAVATMAKDELKWLFGRPWPLTWLKYGSYKFVPFHNSLKFGSFPSGHTSYIAAPMFVLWWRLPQYRWLWIGLVFMVMIGLVGSFHHFVGDVVAGFFLGLAAAAGTVAFGPKVPALQSIQKASASFSEEKEAKRPF